MSGIEKVIKTLVREYKNSSGGYRSAVELESVLYKDWDELGISHPHSDFINDEVFRSVYNNNRLDIYQLLDLMTYRLL